MMLLLIRVGVVLAATLFGLAAVHVFPSLFGVEVLRWVAGAFGIVWALNLLVLPKIGDLSSLKGLRESEQRRLEPMLHDFRKRVWYVFAMCVLCVATMALIVFRAAELSATLLGGAIGFLVGVAVSYVIVVLGWTGEMQAFTDAVRLRDAQQKRLAQAAKELGGGDAKPNGAA